MFVRSWMSSPAVVLLSDTPLLDADRFMEGRQIRQVGVIGSEGLAGLVSRTDIHRVLAYGEPRKNARRTLGDIVVGTPASVSRELPVEHAAETMLMNRVSALPVLEDGRVLGLITSSDVLRAFTYVMGACEGGARLYLSSSDEGDLLEDVRKQSRGLSIRSLVACPSPAGGREVVMRVRGRIAASVA